MRPHRLLALGLLIHLAGCDMSPTVPASLPKEAPKIGPHEGTAFPLPDDAGYVEIVNEPPVSSRDAKATAIVAYFLGADLKSPASAAPADVKFVSKSKASTPMGLDAKSADPAGAKRYATSVGAYNLAEARGEVSGTVAGKPFRVDLEGVR